jgi:hypothetical protein
MRRCCCHLTTQRDGSYCYEPCLNTTVFVTAGLHQPICAMHAAMHEVLVLSIDEYDIYLRHCEARELLENV